VFCSLSRSPTGWSILADRAGTRPASWLTGREARGFWGGYFDRLLPTMTHATFIALAFESQIVKDLC